MRTRIALTLTVCLVTAFQFGCSTHKQFRTSVAPCRTTGTNVCIDAIIEETPSYVLGFVEFDDQGWLWSRRQLDTVMNRLIAEETANRLLILTFVHGWKHNARTDDSNVELVRDNLRRLAALERLTSRREGRPARKVVGVYAGWRGLSTPVPLLKEFTFWERKATAHEVGRGGLCELFLRLEDLRNMSHIQRRGETNQTRLFIVGHSFGGAATYSALSQLLAERTIQTIDREGRGGPPRGVGDMVVLVNPAFEAARYGVLRAIATNQTHLASNLVNLAIFTSKTDYATKLAFPLGRYFSTVFDNHQSSVQRRANRRAVGHFGPFITHDLNYTTNTFLVEAKMSAADEQRQNAEAAERINDLKTQVRRILAQPGAKGDSEVFHFAGSDLVLRAGNASRMPLFNVSVDCKIIPDHNAIDEKEFREFLPQFLAVFEPQNY